jgi:hypothetical protein
MKRLGVLLAAALLPVIAFPTAALAATSADFDYTGTWADGAGGEKATEELGATATLQFNVTGTDGRVGISGLTTPWSGKASVQVDSQAPVTKDLYATASTTAEWYLSPLLPTGPHTVTVKVLHTKRAAATGFWVSIVSARLVRAELGGGPPPPPPPPPPVVTGLPYGADSYFQSRVEAATVDAAQTAAFRNFMATNVDQKAVTWPKINLNPGWSGHNHISAQGDPVWKLGSGGGTDSRLDVLRTQGVHLADAVWQTVPTGTQDRLLVVRDGINGYTMQCADVAVISSAARTFSASNCGIFWHSSNGLDYRNPLSDDARNFTSRGRIPDAMQVPRYELDEAVAAGTGVGHVLHLFFVATDGTGNPCFVHPMVGCEQRQTGWGKEGTQLRISPTVDLAARGLTGAALALARTLQQNGTYLGDNSGSATQIKVGPPADYQGTNLATDAFQGKISWTDFEVVN